MSTTLNYKSFFREEEDREYFGNEGSGVLIVANDTGKLLLFLRSNRVNESGTWNLIGGKMDDHENPKEAAMRELHEETGFDTVDKIRHLYTFRHGDFKYHNHLAIIPFQTTPNLNWEHKNSKWVEWNDSWPSPLHFGLKDLIKHAGHKIKKVIDLIKKKNTMTEDMQTPPAHVQHAPNPAPTIANEKRMTDAYVVVATLWGEARGEGESGMHAVMNVIMNRDKGDFNKAKGICLKPKQFSIWNGISNPELYAINLAKVQRTGGKGVKDGPMYKKAIQLVDQAMKGQLPDITGGATFYFNPKKANPSWAKQMIKIKSIGNHDFYKSK